MHSPRVVLTRERMAIEALQLTNKKRAFVRSNLNSRTHSAVMSNPIGTHFNPVRSFVHAHSEA